MTRYDFGPGTIRMALLGLGFVGLTLALILLQPGPRADYGPAAPEQTVTRTESGITAAPVPAPSAATAPTPAPQPRPAPVARPLPANNHPTELRQMSWGILQQLNEASGRDIAPGDPGSLLHTIVTRAVNDGLPGQSPRN